MKEVVKRIVYGIAYGGVISSIALTILMLTEMTPSIAMIWLYTLMGHILGIYFGLASFIFEIDNWSPLKKTVIHYSLSMLVYFIIALPVGWIPFAWKPIAISIISFTIVYCIFWFGYNMYYKKIETSMNESLLRNK